MIYDLLAPIYDKINRDIDYAAWADFVESAISRFSGEKPELVLDLACGTGSMTIELARRGYDMTGVDLSPEMLDVARSRAAKEKLPHDILWLCQDMREFELYGTVDLAVSTLDSVNHLSKSADLKKTFSLVHNYLIPDGVFLFDVNGKRKFETLYANETYAMEEGGAFCVWQNDYRPRAGLCDFYITLFSPEADGRYRRYDDVETERVYTLSGLRRALSETGFEFLGAYSDYGFSPASDADERIYIAARCKKPLPADL